MIRVSELTSYRFLFILMIFFHHLGVYAGGGTLAVTLFFILGGMMMSFGYATKVSSPSFNYARYLKGRVWKFFPVHWLCLIIAVLLSIPIAFNADYCFRFILNAGLIHSWIPIGRFYLSFNGVSWYLADTLFFTTVFPFLYKGMKKSRYWLVLPILVVYFALVALLPKTYYHPILYVNPLVRMCDFSIGILLGEAFRRVSADGKLFEYFKGGKTILLYLIEIVSLLSLILISWFWGGKLSGLVSAIYWIPASVFLFTVCVRSSLSPSFLKNRFFIWLGSLTFVFYMSHALSIKFFAPMLKTMGLPDAIRAVAVFVLAFGVALLIHYCFEKPVSKWLQKGKIQSSTVQS